MREAKAVGITTRGVPEWLLFMWVKYSHNEKNDVECGSPYAMSYTLFNPLDILSKYVIERKMSAAEGCCKRARYRWIIAVKFISCVG
jgi:hypothetical protein